MIIFLLLLLNLLFSSYPVFAGQDTSLCVKSTSPFGGVNCAPVNTTNPLPVTAGAGGVQEVEGTGTAGVPAGGVLSVQGVVGGTTLPVTVAPTADDGAYSAVTVTNTSAQVLAAGAATIFLQVVNSSASANIACRFGAAAVINGAGSITLTPGGSATWEGTFVPNDALNCISSVASSPATLGVK